MIETLEDFLSVMNKRDKEWCEIENKIDKIKSGDNNLARCIKFLEDFSRKNEIQLIYFGGFLRDVWLGKEPRDVDIVYNHTSEKLVDYLAKNRTLRKNNLGGRKLDIEGIEVDIWSLPNTWYFASADSSLVDRKPLMPITSNLVHTPFFTCESVAMEVFRNPDLDYPSEKPRRLCWENGFFDSCNNGVLEMQDSWIGHQATHSVELQLARAYTFNRKYGWKMGSKLKRFISDKLESSKNGLGEAYSRHYHEEIDTGKIYTALVNMSK